MKAVQRLLFFLVAATTAQTTFAFQPTPQLDIEAVDDLEKFVASNRNLAAKYREECQTLVNAITNQQQLNMALEEVNYAIIKTIVQKPATPEHDDEILQCLIMAIVEEDFRLIQSIAASLDAARFSHLIHHKHVTLATNDGEPKLITVYKLAKTENQVVANFFDKHFPPLR